MGRGEWLDQHCEQKTGMVQGSARISSGGNGIAVQVNGALWMQELLQGGAVPYGRLTRGMRCKIRPHNVNMQAPGGPHAT